MSSKKGFSHGSSNPSSWGKKVAEVSNPNVEQLSHSVSDVKLESVPDGDWEVYTKKPNSKSIGSTANNRGPQKQAGQGSGGWGKPAGNAWSSVPADSRKPTGRGNGRPQPPTHSSPKNHRAPAAVQAPVRNGCSWASVASSVSSKGSSQSGNYGSAPAPHADIADVKSSEDDDDALDDSDDDLASDEFDSDESQKSHETRKKNRWFKKFFESLDVLTQEEINEPGRQWHCPACQGGRGAIECFRGLQPLMSHAKTKGFEQVKLHREFADLLDEEQ